MWWDVVLGPRGMTRCILGLAASNGSASNKPPWVIGRFCLRGHIRPSGRADHRRCRRGRLLVRRPSRI